MSAVRKGDVIAPVKTQVQRRRRTPIERNEVLEEAQEIPRPANPVNSDAIGPRGFQNPLINNVLANGRVELVSPANDVGVATALAASGLPGRVKYRQDVGWLAWDERGQWTSDGVALHIWLVRWIRNLRSRCWCDGEPPSKRDYELCPCDHAKRLEGMKTRETALAAASVLPEFRQNVWDTDPYLIGVANGVVDIRDRSFRAARPEDFITVSAPISFDPKAKAARWTRFMKEIQPDPEARRYLQKAVGSGLTRLTKDQLFYFLLGDGANGKGVFTRACQAALGGLVGMAPSGLFVRQSDQSANRFSLSRLQDCRLLFASEVPQGRALEEYRVKQLTGEDSLVVEEKFRPQLEVRFVATVMMMVNEIPRISEHSHAMRRRLRVIPFTETFEQNAEADLEETLAAEAPGIFNWLLEGAHLWHTEGIGYPDCIRSATESAIRSSFQLHDFFEEVLVEAAGESVSFKELRTSYTEYARARGLQDRFSNGVFGQAIAAFMGSSLEKADNHGIRYRGWRLQQPWER